MTNRQALTYAIENIDNLEVVEKLQKMVEALDKKSANRKPTARQEENATICDKIVAFLTENADKGFTITEIQNAIPECAPNVMPNQRVSALVRGMLTTEFNPNGTGLVKKYVDKRKSYFQIA